MNRWETRRVWLALVLVVAAVTVFRILLIDALTDRTFFAKYIEFADELRAGTLVAARIPDLSPGYLHLVALVRAFGWGVHDIRVVQIVLLSVVAILAGTIAQRIAGVVAGVSAAILVLANKAALVNASEVEPETLLLFAVTTGLALLWSERAGVLFVSGLAFGLAASFRPVALAAAVGLLLLLIARRKGGVLAFIFGLLLPVGAALAANFALTGNAFPMDPATVFYEGMNPNATGYAGVAPRIVKDIEPMIPGPDTMHVAYRVVAARAAGHPLSRYDANRFWWSKSLAFMQSYPGDAARLAGRKAWLVASSHDAYDILSMFLKDQEVRGVWISWGLLMPLALAGAMMAFRASLPVVIYTICVALSPIVLVVTARHRNPLLAGAAILGGIGVASIVDLWSRSTARATVLLVVIAVAAVALSLPTDLQIEDDYLWTATYNAGLFMSSNDIATAATWLPESVPPSSPDTLRTAALRELGETPSAARMLSIAIALIQCGDAADADNLLRRLQSFAYHPYRRTRAVSSVAYYRALALLQLQKAADAKRQLAIARVEAPGDANVLALSLQVERRPVFARLLDQIHDPFTRDWSLARAALAVGDAASAKRLAARAAAGCPEWTVPRMGSHL